MRREYDAAAQTAVKTALAAEVGVSTAAVSLTIIPGSVVVTADALPLVDGRCSPRGWCLVESGKDCRPAAWTLPSRPCEEHNATAAQRELYAQRFKPRSEIDKSMAKSIAMNEA